jgi:hypothetical protein
MKENMELKDKLDKINLFLHHHWIQNLTIANKKSTSKIGNNDRRLQFELVKQRLWGGFTV